MMRRQLLRLAGTLLCSPVLVRAANTGLTGPVPSVDGKRPYGDFANYPVEMAQALGLPVQRQADGSLTVAPALDKELEALHEQTMPAMQVFVRHAGLMRNTV